MPHAVHLHKPKDATRRSIAIFEAVKGLLVLIVGFGLLRLLHRDVEAYAEALVVRMHLNPARHYPQIFIEAASKVNDQNLLWIAAGAALYSIIRFVEAYGLWHHRAWAEWFALVSSSLYVPVEVIELSKHPTPFKAMLLLVNILIVIYFAHERYVAAKHRHHHA